MLNQVIMVGRVQDSPTTKIVDGVQRTTVELGVQRNFKNESGSFDTDFITVELWSGIAQNAIGYLNTGATIGIKARVESKNRNQMKLIAEKITFINQTNER